MPSIIIGTIYSLLVQGTGGIENWGAYLFRRLYWLASGYWYLVVLTIFNLSLLLHRLNRNNRLVTDTMMAVFWYVVFLGLWKKGGDVGVALCMEHCTCFYPFFMFGHLLRKHNKLDLLIGNESLFSASLIGGFLLFFFQTGIHLADNIINRFIVPFCAIIILSHVFAKREHQNTIAERLFSFFGKDSLDIYLWHFVILYNINLRVVHDWAVKTDNMYLEILLAFALSLVVATTCVYFGKFIKQSVWVRNIAYGEIAKKIR